ncbi:hypothetical protein MNBD_GAMMA23-729 [hydrothermal vent metagenome]|uniref:Thioredoxin domain-containing protein n=1 Tax=hydrothermal vent metagenome TaxID=652676 RepID=A0A3B0ZX31_9ZZZZ
MKKITVLFYFLLLLTLHNAIAGQSLIKIFYPGSYAKILEGNKGKAFTLLFWSVDCSSCLEKLKLISKAEIYANQTFVFVSTDGDDMLVDVISVIKQMNLEQQAHWVFKSELTQEIINSVDNTWYGEVPRNYYFDKDHQRIRL